MGFDNLNEIVRQGKSIWVINKTNPLGVISITLNNEGESIKIPKINKPICLSDMATNETLASSPNLRRMLAKKLIVLVPEETARKYYAVKKLDPQQVLQNHAKEEQRKLEIIPSIEDQNTEMEVEPLKVAPNVLNACIVYGANKTIKDEEVLAYFENEWDNFTEQDRGYVISNLGRRPNVIKALLDRQTVTTEIEDTSTESPYPQTDKEENEVSIEEIIKSNSPQPYSSPNKKDKKKGKKGGR